MFMSDSMIFAGVMGIVFSLGGAAAVGSAIRSRRRAAASLTWPRTRGRVLQARVDTDSTDSGGTLYVPNVQYEYTAAGKTWRSSQVSFLSLHSSFRAPADELVRKYAPGTEVEVYYDPRNPACAVLEQQVSSGAFWFTAGLGSVFLLAGLAFSTAWITSLV